MTPTAQCAIRKRINLARRKGKRYSVPHVPVAGWRMGKSRLAKQEAA